MASEVGEEILRVAKSGFRGTSAQWAAKIGRGPATTWSALQRLVAKNEIVVEQIANRSAVYGATPSISMSIVGRKIVIEIEPGGGISARWA